MYFPHICKPLLLVQVKKILSLTLSSIILSMLSVINILKLWCNFFSAARMHNCFQTNTKYLRIVVLQSIYFNHIGIYYFSVEEKNKMLKSGKKTKRKILNWIKVELNEIVIKISDISVKWNKKRAYIRKPKINKKSGLKLLLTLIIQGHMFEHIHHASQSNRIYRKWKGSERRENSPPVSKTKTKTITSLPPKRTLVLSISQIESSMLSVHTAWTFWLLAPFASKIGHSKHLLTSSFIPKQSKNQPTNQPMLCNCFSLCLHLKHIHTHWTNSSFSLIHSLFSISKCFDGLIFEAIDMFESRLTLYKITNKHTNKKPNGNNSMLWTYIRPFIGTTITSIN